MKHMFLLTSLLAMIFSFPAISQEAPPDIPPQRMPASVFLLVSDMAQARDFYAQAFELEPVEFLRDDQGRYFHGEFLHMGKRIFMMGPAGGSAPYGSPPAQSGQPPSFNMYLYVADVDAIYASALKAGADSVQEPRDEFWGDRTAMVRDPFGYLWMLATPESGG